MCILDIFILFSAVFLVVLSGKWFTDWLGTQRLLIDLVVILSVLSLGILMLLLSYHQLIRRFYDNT